MHILSKIFFSFDMQNKIWSHAFIPDTNLGDVYVKMITNYSKKTDGDLKLKIGKL